MEKGHPFLGGCILSKNFFERMPEVKEAQKTSNPNPSAYRWYGRVRVAQEVKMSCRASISAFLVQTVIGFKPGSH